ncbi:MAG: hypothetical protein LBJ08_10475, partial [Bifidobacteriaceae bacterium]|nr:hypothetical protein [Bifidobacteriaceae bacterium]
MIEPAAPCEPTAVFECLEPALEDGEISLRYAARAADGSTHRFRERVRFPFALASVDPEISRPVLRLLSLAASLSYFKAFAPAELVVPGGLTAGERRFSEALIRQGLGEFAYTNNLPEVLQTPISAPELPVAAASAVPDDVAPGPERLLVAVGGGKDSAVSIEVAKAAGFDTALFAANGYKPILDTASVARLPLFVAERELDKSLLALNAAGAPNGHVPVTAVNSLLTVLAALALDRDTVVFSNEASASSGNTTRWGEQINHQWSKSFEFERLLRDTLPAGAPRYVSLLRPLTELRISRRFARLPEYHGVFVSCNRAFKLDAARRGAWCADCPKCRFVFLSLAPFMSREALLEIFTGRDMLADRAQLDGFLDLLGAGGRLKPFECVGEAVECRVALDLLREHPDWRDHPFLADPAVEPIRSAPYEREAV